MKFNAKTKKVQNINDSLFYSASLLHHFHSHLHFLHFLLICLLFPLLLPLLPPLLLLLLLFLGSGPEGDKVL